MKFPAPFFTHTPHLLILHRWRLGRVPAIPHAGVLHVGNCRCEKYAWVVRKWVRWPRAHAPRRSSPVLLAILSFATLEGRTRCYGNDDDKRGRGGCFFLFWLCTREPLHLGTCALGSLCTCRQPSLHRSRTLCLSVDRRYRSLHRRHSLHQRQLHLSRGCRLLGYHVPSSSRQWPDPLPYCWRPNPLPCCWRVDPLYY
jgi:hypothetical protein